MRLATFISHHKESILQNWESFARSIVPPAIGMDIDALRDHAALMLDAIITDLDTEQSEEEQRKKSLGQATRAEAESYAELHAAGRMRAGYTMNQLVSEYRALRASVLRLWAEHSPADVVTQVRDVTRFNEAIDQALAESVARFASMTEEASENERRRLDAVLEAAPVGICVADRTGRLVLTNAENKCIWGEYPMPGDVEAYAEWKGWWADDSARHGERVLAREWATARALAGEEVHRDTVEIEPFDAPGTRKTILLRARPVRDETGAVVGAVLAQTDITAQVRTEAALRESEAKFRTIADAMPQMVWSTRPDGHHDYYNQQWYDFTGVPLHSTDGEGWNQMFHPEDQARAWSAWRHSLTTGETYEVQYRLRHRSGEYRWTLGRALPVRDESGRIIRWMGTCTDIHDQKLAEEELKKQSQRKDQFLAMLAHELRNPLAPISTAAKLLELAPTDPKRVQHAGEIISRQVKHMTDLVDDLLDVSRVTRGLVQLEKRLVDLKLVVTHAIEQVRPLIETRHHELTVRMASGSVVVEGDPTRLVQVVANILNNAAKYTPQGGQITVSLDVLDGHARIQVSDDGSGIAPTLLPYVFHLFSQGQRTPDRSQGGLGLGLALVKQITSLHGGEVTAESEGMGKGSKFTVTLPRVVKQSHPVREQPRTREDRPAGAVDIMIVDDNVDAARSLAELLRATGHRVTVAENASRALESMHKESTQLFVLDIGLPDIDGYELARRLRNDPATADAVLVALTGYGEANDRLRSKEAGFDHHFIKPLDMTQLDELLKDIASGTPTRAGAPNESTPSFASPRHR